MANINKVVVDGVTYDIGGTSEAPVTSVNGKTGAVVLTPADIGAKAIQTAKSSPSASGTAVEFISDISQDAQGVITATKKTVRSANSSQSGLMSSTDKGNLKNVVNAKNAIIMLRDELSYPIAEGSVVLRYNGTRYALCRAKIRIASDTDDVDASWEYLSNSSYSSGYLSEIVANIKIAHDSVATDYSELVYPLLPYTICNDSQGNMMQLGASGADDAGSAWWSLIPNLGYCVAENRRLIASASRNASKAMSMAQGLSYSLAPNYSSSIFPVKAGQMALYSTNDDKRLYRALVDIPVAEDFTAAHWKRVTVDELINALEAKALAAYPTAAASGFVASIPDGAEGLLVKALTVDISTETGVTGATITRCGKNLLNANSAATGTSNGVTYTVSKNSAGAVTDVCISGTASALSTRSLIPQSANWRLPAGDYVLSKCTDDYLDYQLFVNCYNGSAYVKQFLAGNSSKQVSFTLDYVGYDHIAVGFVVNSGKTVDVTCYPAIFPAGAVQDFEPYEAQTYAVDWTDGPGAITGGVLDAVAGTLTTGGQTYDVTPVAVETLLGANAIYADCGDVSVTYRADPTLYGSRGQTEDDMTANSPIASGKYFQIGNTLYRATAAIATGETIVPGTNCAVTNLAEALNLLNA